MVPKNLKALPITELTYRPYRTFIKGIAINFYRYLIPKGIISLDLIKIVIAAKSVANGFVP